VIRLPLISRAPGDAAEAPAPAAVQGGVPREILRQVRRIEMRTRGLVDSIFGGEYQSVFRGQGMEFAEVREYQPGDDIRTIDWNVTARTGHPYVKKHVEERELTLLLAVDLSGSEQFGTRGRFKAELAAELAAVLALSAVRNNDRVGLLIFTDRVEHVVPPKKGRRHVLRLIRDVLAFRPAGTGTNLAIALDYGARLLPHRGIIFLVSDFLPPPGQDWPPADGWEKSLRLTSRRHDLVAVSITDPAEAELPAAGLIVLRDPESGRDHVVDSGSAVVRQAFAQRISRERAEVRRTFRRLGIDEVQLQVGQGLVAPLLSFFRRRERQRAR
jgi:uncharacterized protein (DUF58 family)